MVMRSVRHKSGSKWTKHEEQELWDFLVPRLDPDGQLSCVSWSKALKKHPGRTLSAVKKKFWALRTRYHKSGGVAVADGTTREEGDARRTHWNGKTEQRLIRLRAMGLSFGKIARTLGGGRTERACEAHWKKLATRKARARKEGLFETPRKEKTDNDMVVGEVCGKDEMFMGIDAGEASLNDKKYGLSVSMQSTPIVLSRQTGKWYVLTWEDIVRLAVQRGIDAE